MQEVELKQGKTDLEVGQTQRVTKALRRQIVEGKRKSGDRLNERILSEEFEVSRLPVREALRQLIKEGLVERNPREFAMVRTQTVAEVSNLLEVRGVLDDLAVRLACQRRTEEDLQEIRKVTQMLKTQSADAEEIRSVCAPTMLGRAIYRAAHSATLLEMWDLLSSRAARSYEPKSFAAVEGKTWEKYCDLIEAQNEEGALEIFHEIASKVRNAIQEDILSEDEGELRNFYAQSYMGVRKTGGIVPTRPAEDLPEPEHLAIVRSMAQQIVEGNLKPGEVLSERRVADEFGVSRMPARQAIEQLIAEGLVYQGSSRVPATVRGLTRIEVEDYLEVVTELDRLMFKTAAARWNRKELYILSLRLEAEVKKIHNHADLMNAVFAFRNHIYKMSHNTVAMELNALLENRYKVIFTWNPSPEAVIELHKLIFGAIESRNEELTVEIFDRLASFLHPTQLSE